MNPFAAVFSQHAIRQTGCASSSRCQVSRKRRTENGGRISHPPRSRDRLSRSSPSTPSLRPSRKTTIFKPYISSECPETTLANSTWWSWTGSNRRPHACKARALPTELQPRVSDQLPVTKQTLVTGNCSPVTDWWAWEDLNLRPHAYQARALTN